MKMIIKIEFNPHDSAEALLAITDEQAALSLEEFTAQITPAIALVHHNMQAYGQISQKAPLVTFKQN